jgi:hypothetical protein
MATRKRSVKSVSAKGPANNPQPTVKTGQVSGVVPTARSGALPGMVSANTAPMAGQPSAMQPAANPQVAAQMPQAMPQVAAHMPGEVPQMTASSAMPNNINTQQSVAGGPAAKPAVRKSAKVSSVKKKNPMVADASAQPSNQAAFQEAPSEKPTFNFFFAGKTPF